MPSILNRHYYTAREMKHKDDAIWWQRWLRHNWKDKLREAELDYSQAYEFLLLGDAIQREEWDKREYIYLDHKNRIIHKKSNKYLPWAPTKEDKNAEDWKVI